MNEEKKQLTLSIIVPVYNVEKYLKECLDSLLKQDIPKDCYEIICINDGSTDGSGMILDEYAKNNENINVIHKENGGVSSARNLGIDHARGEYIWFVDSDDMIRPNCLKNIVELIENYQPGVIKIGNSMGEEPKWGDYKNLNFEVYNGVSRSVCNSVWQGILRSDIIKKHTIYFSTDMIVFEDTLFHYCYYLWNRRNDIGIREVLYFYRSRSGSAVDKMTTRLRVLNNFFLINVLKDELDKVLADQSVEMEDVRLRQIYCRIYLSVRQILHLLPKTDLDKKYVLNTIRERKMNIPFFWRWPKDGGTIQWRIRCLFARFLNLRPVYWVYYKIQHRRYKRISN